MKANKIWGEKTQNLWRQNCKSSLHVQECLSSKFHDNYCYC